MKRKKMMSLLLSAVAAVSMIAGCGNQAAGTSGEGNAPTSESREAGTDAAAAEETGERPTISIMCIDIYGSAMGNVGSEDVLKAAEDYTGVNVDFNWVANDSYNDILGVTLMDKANMPW